MVPVEVGSVAEVCDDVAEVRAMMLLKCAMMWVKWCFVGECVMKWLKWLE